MSEQQPQSLRPAPSGSRRSRRSTLRALRWLTVLVLLGFVIAVATGVFGSSNSASVESSGSSSSSKAASAESSKAPAGWGPLKSYIGRYRLLSATQQSAAGVTTRLTGGELTMFMREIHKGAPLVPSGILTLQAPAPTGTELLYLTSLSSYGTTHEAVVNGGAFVGPVVGSLAAIPTAAGRLSLTAKVEGIGAIRASFMRFSDSSQP